jgi:hypothetical protein
MTIHWHGTAKWKRLGQQGRIDAIKMAWEEGDSGTDIAARLGVTRNSIAGVYFRHAEALKEYPRKGNRGPRRKAVLPVVVQAPPKPPRPEWVDESHGAGRPLMMIQRRQCKWPVNDAAPDELHLFCGLPAEGPYCSHHASRTLREVR